jgi:hypothetical protein
LWRGIHSQGNRGAKPKGRSRGGYSGGDQGTKIVVRPRTNQNGFLTYGT